MTEAPEAPEAPKAAEATEATDAAGNPGAPGAGPAAGEPARLWRTLRELPRPVTVLLTGVAVNRLGGQVQIFLVLYLTTRLGFGPARAGAALTVYGAGSVAGVFAGGPTADRIGPNRTIVLAMAGSGVLVGLLPFVHPYPAILGVCLGAGAVTQLYRPAALALLAALTPADRLVIVSAAYRLGLNVGVTLAPLLGVALAVHSYTLVFLVDAVTSLAFAALALFALPDARPRAEADDREEGGQSSPKQTSYRAVIADKPFLLVIGAMLATALIESQYQSVLPLQIHARGLPTTLYAAVLAINGAMVILFELPLTPYVQRLPLRVPIAVGSVLIGLGISGFGIPAGYWLFIACAVVWTTGEIVSAPSISAYPALIAPPALRGRYISSLSTSQTLGYTVGPGIGTVLYQYLGSATWFLCIALAAVAGVGMWTGVTQPPAGRTNTNGGP
jgi:MFS family permease